MVEQRPFKPLVEGSSPSALTSLLKNFGLRGAPHIPTRGTMFEPSRSTLTSLLKNLVEGPHRLLGDAAQGVLFLYLVALGLETGAISIGLLVRQLPDHLYK